jgi:selenocysteine-specific elongation factor
MKYVIAGTAGHIDHGKSALVRALTGTDPDRLEEEKRRGITIDLGFAHLDLGDDIRLGFIDVPGHERFVRNMLAGVGGIDLVLLVVAADESIKPQTREHFDICRLLGVRRGLVVLTKADLVDPEILDLVKLEVQDFVAGSFLEGAPVVAVSARTGQGLDALVSALGRLSQEIVSKPLDLPFRLPIDRAFVMKGFGAVVTGTLVAGRIETEAEVEIHPLGRRVRVRGIEVHNQAAEAAVAGQRTALNLAGIEARELARGMMLAPCGLFQPTVRLDAVVSLLASARPLKNRARVHFHCWTAEAVAEVVLLDRKELAPGGTAYAQLRLAEPGLYLPGDRFIIRQFSPVTTIGGGVILDNQPPKHRSSDPGVRQRLEALEQGDAEARLELLVSDADEVSHSALVARTGWQTSEVLRVGKLLEAKKRLLILGQPPSLFVSTGHFETLKRRAVEELEKFHQANPLVTGLAKEELRGRLASRASGEMVLPSSLLFNSVLQTLSAAGKVSLQGELVRAGGREIQLTPEEVAAKDQISRAFEQASLAVPSAKEVLGALRIDRARAEKILHLLLREKTLVKVAEDLIFHRAALERLRRQVAQRKGRDHRIDVAVFKEMTGLTRKYAIPLLEYLDRERVTRREGDTRVIL